MNDETIRAWLWFWLIVRPVIVIKMINIIKIIKIINIRVIFRVNHVNGRCIPLPETRGLSRSRRETR